MMVWNTIPNVTLTLPAVVTIIPMIMDTNNPNSGVGYMMIANDSKSGDYSLYYNGPFNLVDSSNFNNSFRGRGNAQGANFKFLFNDRYSDMSRFSGRSTSINTITNNPSEIKNMEQEQYDVDTANYNMYVIQKNTRKAYYADIKQRSFLQESQGSSNDYNVGRPLWIELTNSYFPSLKYIVGYNNKVCAIDINDNLVLMEDVTTIRRKVWQRLIGPTGTSTSNLGVRIKQINMDKFLIVALDYNNNAYCTEMYSPYLLTNPVWIKLPSSISYSYITSCYGNIAVISTAGLIYYTSIFKTTRIPGSINF